MSVVIADAGGGAVAYTICQNLNTDNLCGNQDPTIGPIEPRVAGCGTSAALVGFLAGRTTSVFVRAVDATCSGTATSGTITLTSSP